MVGVRSLLIFIKSMQNKRKEQGMKICELLSRKQSNLWEHKPITIAFLGDSVTQGCFECYLTSTNGLETVFDYKNVYSTRVREILNILYPTVQVNIINSGISGDCAAWGVKRLERDILSYNPDLVVVSYGLNDSSKGMDGIKEYIHSLETIFLSLKDKETEIVFLTQNYMNTQISPHLKEEKFINLAKSFSENTQNSGVLKAYFEEAIKSCEKYNVKVCNLYAAWEKINNAGVNTTELLANKLNHPIREMHYYIAIKLIETMLEVS